MLLATVIGSHNQLVKKIDWSLKQPNSLASLSQDGIIKIWVITFYHLLSLLSPFITFYNLTIGHS